MPEHNNYGCVGMEDGYVRHEYASKECPNCGTVFCYNCCGWTNVHIGGKYEADRMDCPICGHDYYSKTV